MMEIATSIGTLVLTIIPIIFCWELVRPTMKSFWEKWKKTFA